MLVITGENNLPYMAGNVLDGAGYACLLPTMIQNWREVWSAEPGTTDPQAPFGIVVLADSSDVSTQAIILGSIKRRNGLDQSSAGKLF